MSDVTIASNYKTLAVKPSTVISFMSSGISHAIKTPRSRRLMACSGTTPQEPSAVEENEYKNLLQKTWVIYSLSPLYKFRSSKIALTKYARSLDAALSQEKDKCFGSGDDGLGRSSFSVCKGLNFNCEDAETIKIQVTVKHFSDKSVETVLKALLVSMDLDVNPVPQNLASKFTFYPMLMVTGNKARINVLLSWLECHFDCRVSPVTFSDTDMRWMLAAWSTLGFPVKTYPVLMQYSLTQQCDGISSVDCRFDTTCCRELWERLNSSSSASGIMNEQEVNKFVDALEEHLQYTMRITFSKLNLTEVGTPVAYVSSQGKIKLLSSSSVYLALHLVCEIVKDKFMEISFSHH